MILETPRLTLRPWKESDAASLHEYAKDPRVGPAAGWPPHTSVENSLAIIQNVLATDENYAVTLKPDDDAIGSITLLTGIRCNLPLAETEAELGYWLGAPFWGRGVIPEAAREVMRHAFEDLRLTALWCEYFDDNARSKRVCEKCGFRFQYSETREWPLIKATKLCHVARVTEQEWMTSLAK